MNTEQIIKLARDAAAKHGQELNESPEPEIVAFLVEFHTLATKAERESRQATQTENEQLKARLARSGVELRKAVRDEREACAIAAVIHSQYPITTDYDKGYDAGRRNAAAAIRARNHTENNLDMVPGLALDSGEFVPAEKITEKLKCWCTTCRPITPCNARFVVCPECGNKRCPKAHNHELTCTNSNDVGQKGSSWEHVKPFAQNNDPEDKTDWAAA